MPKVVVTGATGFIGFHVAAQLVAEGHSPLLLVRRRSYETARLEKAGATLHLCSLAEPASYEAQLQGADVLFHLAAENSTDTRHAKRTIANTLGLTETVIAASIRAGVSTIVYTSSVVVLGRSKDKTKPLTEADRVDKPESPYVQGKLLAEQWVEGQIALGHDIRRIYPSWVVGPGDPKLTPPHKFIKDFASKGQKIYFEGGVSVAAVTEVAKAHVNAWTVGKRNGQYVLAGDNVTFEQLYAGIAEVFGQKKPAIKVPKFIIKLGASVLKVILGDASPVDPEYVESIIGRYSWYDSSKAVKELGYKVPPLAQTLQTVKGDIDKRLRGLYFIRHQGNDLPARQFDHTDRLLITGFPGWLANRMVEVFMNGDYAGRNKINRKIRLLALPGTRMLPDLSDNFEVVEGDVRDPESLERALQGVTTVYHLAGVIYPKDLSQFETVNHQGTVNLANACLAQGVSRLVYMSTDSTVGYARKGEPRVFDETTPDRPYKGYGTSKWLGESYVLNLSKGGRLMATSLRGFWFFGPHVPERNMTFFRSFTWPFQIVFGNGRNLRSISHLDDLIEAFLQCEKNPASFGKKYWIPSIPPPKTVHGIYELIARGLGRKLKPVHVPNWVCSLCDTADSLLIKFGILNPTIHAAGKFHRDIAGTYGAAERDFGYKPMVTEAQVVKEIEEDLKYS